MRKSNTMMSLLLLSAVFITPASANWFSNPRTGTNLNIGSAPNPTPADLRAIGDAKLAMATEPRATSTHIAYVQPTKVEYVQTMNTAQLTGMEGRTVWGSHGERLGFILTVDQGKRLYTSPIVWHLAVVMVLSGAATAPTMNLRLFGAAAGGLAVLGLGIGIRSAVGIWRTRMSGADSAFDLWWYGLAPAFVYVGLAVASLGIFGAAKWGASIFAAALMALLLLSIHAEWDLVTFLAPRASPPDPSASKKKR